MRFTFWNCKAKLQFLARVLSHTLHTAKLPIDKENICSSGLRAGPGTALCPSTAKAEADRTREASAMHAAESHCAAVSLIHSPTRSIVSRIFTCRIDQSNGKVVVSPLASVCYTLFPLTTGQLSINLRSHTFSVHYRHRPIGQDKANRVVIKRSYLVVSVAGPCVCLLVLIKSWLAAIRFTFVQSHACALTVYVCLCVHCSFVLPSRFRPRVSTTCVCVQFVQHTTNSETAQFVPTLHALHYSVLFAPSPISVSLLPQHYTIPP